MERRRESDIAEILSRASCEDEPTRALNCMGKMIDKSANRLLAVQSVAHSAP